MRLHVLVVFLLWIFFSSALWAQTAATVVVVEADAIALPGSVAALRQGAGFVNIIEARRYQNRLMDLGQLLNEAVGINVRRSGGFGSFSTVSIRGSSAEQVTVLLDGVPLNQAASGSVDLSTIPLTMVQRIEVYRSHAPLHLASAAIGGVVNIVLKKPGKKPTGQLKAAYGSWQQRELSAVGQGQWAGVDTLAGVHFSGSKGDFRFLDDGGTPLNAEDDRLTRRRNNDFDAWGGLLRASRQWGGWRWTASQELFHKTQGVPGIDSNQSLNARLKHWRSFTNLQGIRQGFISDALDLQLNGYWLWQRMDYRNPKGETGVGLPQDSKNRTNGWGVHSLWRYWGQQHRPELLLGVQQQRFKSSDTLNSIGNIPSQQRRVWQVGLSDHYTPLQGLLINPQILWTGLENNYQGRVPFTTQTTGTIDNQDYWSGSLGIRYDATAWLRLKANVGRAFRYPNFSELFGDQGTVIGNPNLKAERGFSTDWGVAVRLPSHLSWLQHANGEVGGFYRRITNMISYEQNSQRTVRAENIASARLLGLESRWQIDAKPLSLRGNYTYIASKNTSDIPFLRGRQLPGVPKHSLFQRVALQNPWGQVFYELDFTADTYLDQANFRRVKHRLVHNVGLGLVLWQHWHNSFEVRNISNQRGQDTLGFPLPGRSYQLTTRWQFGAGS